MSVYDHADVKQKRSFCKGAASLNGNNKRQASWNESVQRPRPLQQEAFHLPHSNEVEPGQTNQLWVS